MSAAPKTVKMTQILAAQFTSASGVLSYSMFGLGADGVVYRYDPACDGWIAWPMMIAGCRQNHKGRR